MEQIPDFQINCYKQEAPTGAIYGQNETRIAYALILLNPIFSIEFEY